VAYLHRNGACFAVEDAFAEQQRSDAGEISPSGPLFGGKMRAATGEAGELEGGVLEEAGLSADLFAGRHAGKRRGARRPLRFFPEDPGATAGSDADGPYVELTFTLPPGCYATVLLRELCHREVG
jgi:tRNA pseudouridine13 synthase